MLITPSLTALAFFEAITIALRNAGYPDFDNELGASLEHVVAEVFSDHGIDVQIQGDEYRMVDPLTQRQQKGECDVVAEGPELIVFAETKKNHSDAYPLQGIRSQILSIFPAACLKRRRS